MPTKNCIDCGKEFYTPTTSVRCVECRTIHKQKLTKLRNDRNHAAWLADPDNREYKRKQAREHYKNNREWYRKYHKDYYRNKLKQKRRLAALDKTEIEVDGKKLVLYECPRLKVKSSKLPCGERWECFHNGKCSCVPRGKTPKTFEECVMSPRRRFNPAF